MSANTWPVRRCAGPCDQGRRPCPAPQACAAPDDENDADPRDSAIFWRLYGAAVLVAVCATLVILAA